MTKDIPNGLWISIDPGMNTGLAVWQNANLVDIMTFRSADSDWLTRLLQVSKQLTSYVAKRAHPKKIIEVCAELPEFRPGRYEVNASGDFVKLSMSLGIVLANIENACGTTPKYRLYTPSKWKGQMDGDITRSRVCEIMSDFDLEKIPQHEIDAIGIGLHRLELL